MGKTPQKKAPSERASLCLFSVKTQNEAYFHFIEAYLNQHFDYEKTPNDNGCNYVILSTIPPNIDTKQSLILLAEYLSAHRTIHAFSPFLQVDKYQAFFNKALRPEGTP